MFSGIDLVKVVLKDRRRRGSRDTVYLDENMLTEEGVDSGSGDLNPRLTFDTFVIGASNRFAHAAALSVSENPTSYNPLYIYGGVGLGKTHLLHSIGHYTKRLYPNMKILYRSSEQFLNDFINSLTSNSIPVFQKRYRSIDMLLIDDIQFLANKERTVEEFFHTFNDLHNNNKQIVLSSDCPPKEITGLQDRLISRFEWGLITDIQPPELETRIAILRKKSALDNKDVPDEVINYIASRFDSNIRELEGALIRVVAYSSLAKEPITPELAKDVLRDILPEEESGDRTSTTSKVTADHFNLSIKQLTSPTAPAISSPPDRYVCTYAGS